MQNIQDIHEFDYYGFMKNQQFLLSNGFVNHAESIINALNAVILLRLLLRLQGTNYKAQNVYVYMCFSLCVLFKFKCRFMVYGPGFFRQFKLDSYTVFTVFLHVL